MFKKRSAKIVPSSSSGVEREEEPKKKKIERVEKEDVEQRMKTNSESEAQEITKEIIEEESKKLKMKEFLISEFEKKCPVEKRRGGETHLHCAAFLGHVEATKVLLENDGAVVNDLDKENWTPLHVAAFIGHTEICKIFEC